MTRHLGTLVLVVALALALAPAALRAELTGEQVKQDYERFWKSYLEAYVFWDLKGQEHGVTAAELRAEYEPTLAQCATKRDLLRLVAELQSRLHDGHCGNEGMTAVGPLSLAPLGFVDGEGHRIFVRAVKAGSAFATAGVSRGDELLTWCGDPVQARARRFRSLMSASSEGQFWNLFGRLLHVWHPFQGAAPATCTATFRKPDGTEVAVDSPWQIFDPAAGAKDGDASLDKVVQLEASGPLPLKAAIYEDLNVGYLQVESFMKTQDPTAQLDKVFTALKDTKGLVLDLRGNGGGVGPWGVLLASYMIPAAESGPKVTDTYMDRLYSETFFRLVIPQATDQDFEELFTTPDALRQLFGQMGITLTAEEMATHFVDGRYVPFYVRMLLGNKVAGVPAYEKPVVALTDGGCFSTTDITLALLSEFKRVTLVGTPNGAGSGSPIPFVLPNAKVKVMVPHARAYPPSGAMIEGHPLTPDLPVEVTQQDLVAGVDRHLATALGFLGQQLGLVDGASRGAFDEVPLQDLARRPVADTLDSHALPEELRPLLPQWLAGADLRREARGLDLGAALRKARSRAR